MDKELFAHYRAVLTHELAARERLAVELKIKDGVIAGLMAVIEAHEAEMRSTAAKLPFGPPAVPESLKYAGMSVRWAVLGLMAEDERSDGGLTTPDMAAVLVSGGARSHAGKNFAGNVSAVVSEMVRRKGELESAADGKYVITAHGREVWEGIKRNPAYWYRSLSDKPETAVTDVDWKEEEMK